MWSRGGRGRRGRGRVHRRKQAGMKAPGREAGSRGFRAAPCWTSRPPVPPHYTKAPPSAGRGLTQHVASTCPPRSRHTLPRKPAWSLVVLASRLGGHSWKLLRATRLPQVQGHAGRGCPPLSGAASMCFPGGDTSRRRRGRDPGEETGAHTQRGWAGAACGPRSVSRAPPSVHVAIFDLPTSSFQVQYVRHRAVCPGFAPTRPLPAASLTDLTPPHPVITHGELARTHARD